MTGNTVLKTRMRRWVMDEFGTDPRTYRRNCEAMVALDLMHDGGGVWIIPHRVFDELEKDYSEGVGI